MKGWWYDSQVIFYDIYYLIYDSQVIFYNFYYLIHDSQVTFHNIYYLIYQCPNKKGTNLKCASLIHIKFSHCHCMKRFRPRMK